MTEKKATRRNINNYKQSITKKKRRNANSNAYKSKFNKDYYYSGDGMLTTVWGPPMWHYLHTMSFNYPINPTMEDQEHYKTFVEMLQHTLPCKYCRDNFKQNLKILPMTKKVLKDRNSFSRYIYTLHNLVNKMLGKNISISYEEVRDRYENFRARCSKNQVKEKTFRLKKEKGCTQPLYGEKSKCVIKIVPQTDISETFVIDQKCERRH